MRAGGDKGPCSVNGCDRMSYVCGWCTAHYFRARRNGDPGRAEVSDRKRGACSVDGCDRETKGLGYCLTHYTRVRRTGDPGSAEIWDRRRKSCSVDGCDRLTASRGLCGKHYQRLQTHGSAEYVPTPRCGPDNPSWRGEDITYAGAHDRTTDRYGPAREHICVDCGGQARNWSYNHGDPAQRTSPEGLTYSPDPAFYEPRCVSCHRRFDFRVRREAAAS